MLNLSSKAKYFVYNNPKFGSPCQLFCFGSSCYLTALWTGFCFPILHVKFMSTTSTLYFYLSHFSLSFSFLCNSVRLQIGLKIIVQSALPCLLNQPHTIRITKCIGSYAQNVIHPPDTETTCGATLQTPLKYVTKIESVNSRNQDR